MELIHETKKYYLFREKNAMHDRLIMENKRTGERHWMDTQTFIDAANRIIDEVKQHD